MSCNDVMWEPNEGEELPIHDMADTHLINARRSLQRARFAGPPEYYPNFQGEMAQEAAEAQFYAAWDAHDHMVLTLLPALETEIRRRGLRTDHTLENGNVIRRRIHERVRSN